jgi:AraC family transcriptional regulator
MRVNTQGHILAWQGGSLWIGRTKAVTGLHAHHAIQVTLGLEGWFRLGGAPDALGPERQAAIVAADWPHAFAADATIAMVFIEPESAAGRAVAELHCRGDAVSPLPPGLLGEAPAALLDAFGAGERSRMEAVAREVIGRLGGDTAHGRRLEPDPRVLRVLRLLAAEPDAAPSLPEAAAAVRLSPGRLRHLFVQETGLHYRGYLLWLRLGRAVAVLAGGGALTEAAHAAGFADSAHLSRTFRRMFGLAPSELRIG